MNLLKTLKIVDLDLHQTLSRCNILFVHVY